MRIISFIEDRNVIRIILTHLGLWLIRSRPPPKKHTSIETVSAIAANATLASVLEIFLAKTTAFVWVYPWWGATTVFISVYIPFFVISAYCYDWKPAIQKKFIGGLFALNVAMLIIFGAVLGWI